MKVFDSMFDRTMGGLSRLMDLTWRRNEALTSNIANAETPQYRASDLHFANELNAALGRAPAEVAMTNEKHIDVSISSNTAFLTADNSGATKADGNNVDIDVQMGKLAQNTGQYSIASNLMRKKLTIIANAIRQTT